MAPVMRAPTTNTDALSSDFNADLDFCQLVDTLAMFLSVEHWMLEQMVNCKNLH
jgi:hypothetical protein